MPDPKYDRIGYWSEVKLEIVRKYAKAYSTILSRERTKFSHVYIDGFAGAGVHLARKTKGFVPGSPLNALLVEPPFVEHFLIDLDGDKVAGLKRLVGDGDDVHIVHGDCNRILLEDVFPQVRYEDYRRALCLLDPYGLHLDWKVMASAGKLGTIDLFLNFPIMDMNRNALWRNQAGVSAANAKRMTCFWGDESWKEIAYRDEPTLFGPETVKLDNKAVASAFRRRLQEIAGFKQVPEPLAMRNSTGAEVYYLFFASQKTVASKIAREIYAKYRDRPR